MKLAKLTPAQLKSIDRTLSGGTWTITAGAVLFSVLTVTPLVQRVTTDRWDWTAPILPIVVDAAVVIVIRLDATVSRLGESGGRWPDILRWLTGMFTVALNIGDSALKRDLVGVAVHAVAPVLLIATAEASLAYRRAITRALERIDREQREEAEARRVHERQEREERERSQREREDRERAERQAELDRAERIERERAEQEREAERLRLDHEAKMAREQREAEEARRRDEADRADRRAEQERKDREAREARERADRERREREEREKAAAEKAAREQQEREARERAEAIARERRERRTVNTSGGSVNTAVNTRRAAPVNTPAKAPVNDDRLPEDDARALIVNTPGASVRDLADKTGWSVGWVSKVRREAGGEAEEATAA
ncbi:DUF2637 domain-containing protein [Streptomyces sp. NPDC057362]|uniref:DUF2637 domain-containing protein n=1 Tax=Streptomyces sp. NPDC057362 TaxID=3346106 RepID=UPI0036419C43